ncbi:hypothetical protein GCE9029_01176 [Grimontia celer]|uniref:Uncharacterized protein n=1 Tax=Grimontia celer TaxID=1796497 RepID=A0A128EWM6_9GAMM|nr:hypothetical protein [Grimontia celer]CZF78978.1 hypothetical protein GCE9029_01176 [Grimontia celer]
MATQNLANVYVTMAVSDYEYIKGMVGIEKITKQKLQQAQKDFDLFEKKTGASLNKANKNFNGFAGQFGYQAQDLIVQIQGGQNALLAIGQQGSQLASVLHPLAGLFVVLGTTAATLAIQFFDLGGTVEKTAEQIDQMAKDTENLTTAQRELVKIELTKRLIEQSDAHAKNVEALEKELASQNETLQTYKNVAKAYTFTENGLAKYDALQQKHTETEIKLRAEIDESNKALSDTAKLLDNLDPKQKEQAMLIADSVTAYESLTLSLTNSIDTYGLTDIAVEKFNARLKLGAGATQEQIDAIDSLIDKKYELAEADKKADAQLQYFEQQLANEEKFRQDQIKAQAAFDKQIEQLQINNISNANDKLAAQQEAEIESYRNQKEQLLISEEDFQLAKEEIQKKYAQKQIQLTEQVKAAELKVYSDLASSIGSTFSQLSEESSAFATVAFLAQQAAAFGNAIINAELASTNALANVPAPYNVAVAAAARTAGYISAGVIAGTTIASVATGQYHGGTDYVPDSMNNQSFLLKAGERVIQPEANKDLSEFLEKQKSGKAGESVQVVTNNTFNNGGKDFAGMVMKTLSEQPKQTAAIVSKGQQFRPTRSSGGRTR